MRLTLKQLEKMGACPPALDRFQELFGENATVSAVVEALHREGLGDWELWLLMQNVPLTRKMLTNGANACVYNDEALQAAVEDGDLEMAKLLIDHGAKVRADYGRALRNAVWYRELKMVKLLVAHGANVGSHSDAAFRIAVHYGYREIVRYLESVMAKTK